MRPTCVQWIQQLRRAPLLLVAWLAAQAGGPPEPNPEPYPIAHSKKGLQVQMVEDALVLGIRHAALNVNLATLADPKGNPDNPGWELSGRTYHFHRAALESLDQQIRPLSDRGVLVSLILLNYVSGDPEVRRLLQHPGYDTNCPNHLSAFNTSTAEARQWLTAAVEMMAARWSRPDGLHGRVWNWIVGNEVNSHWFWSNMGRVTLKEFTGDYLRAVRLVHEAVRRQSLHGRVYVSLEHHWNIRYPGGDAGQAFPGRDFLDLFARQAAEGGDFDWHVAFHPYPENLFNPRTWNDASATPDWRTTPRITFRNLDQLIRYLEQPELRHAGKVRRVILSEQGFHTPDGPDGEIVQAAAYVYAWKQVMAQPGIDAFILHRHVDHAHEGGLRLGLWRREPESVCTPSERKRLYEVFRLADTPSSEEAFAFAAPVIGASRSEAP